MTKVDVVFAPDGTGALIYTDAVDADALGRTETARASHVAPAPGGGWTADMAPSGGPVLGPFRRRAEALEAEVAWIRRNVLGLSGGQ